MVCQIMSEEATHLLAENTAKIKKNAAIYASAYTYR